MGAFAVVALGVAIVLATVTRSAAATPAPTQWIAKQYTELLGRAPTAAEWKTQLAYYGAASTPCNVTTLATLGKSLARSTAFKNAYPESTALGKAARVTALVRAVYSHDPNTNDWAAYYTPYANGSRTWDQVVDDIYGNGVFAAFLLPSVCSATQASYGFGYSAPLDLKALTGGGASRTQAELQAAIDAAPSGGRVQLQPGEVIRVGGAANGNQGLRVKSGVELSTAGNPATTKYALMGRIVPAGLVCNTYLCNDVGVVTLAPGASLKNVWVDGQGADATTNYKLANVETSGSDATLRTDVLDNRITHPGRDGVGVRARGFSTSGSACSNERILRNLITGYPSRHEPDGLAQAQWVDGIAVHCEQATVQSNVIVDVSDAGVTLYGAYNRSLAATAVQRSTVSGNTVLSAGLDARVAYGADPIGECQSHRGGWVVPCLEVPTERSFAGASIASNTFWSGPRTHYDVGLLVGGAPEWGNHRVPGRGVSVTGNTTAGVGARVNMGVSVLGMFDVTLTGNTASYTLVDGNPGVVDAKCPLVAVGVGSSAKASVRSGAQASTIHDSADGCLVPAPPAGGLERIVRKADGSGFMGATTGRTFVPWGMNYDQHIEEWWNSDWARLVSDFREMRRMGVNTVRVLLETVRFLDPPTAGYPNGTPNVAALAQLTRLVRLAEQTGLYLDVTGLGIEIPAAQQPWYDDRDENGRWAAQERFWISVAQAVGTSPAVAWFDLMNEPTAQAGPGGAWCAGLFGDHCYVQYLTDDAAGRTSVQIARAWMTRMKTAIRVTAGDTTHLISVGLLPYGYSGFRPSDVTDLEDFGTVHMYPRADVAGTPANELQLDIDSVKSFKPAGQPLVIEEMLNMNCSESDLETFVLGTRPEVGGWLGHYGTQTPAEIATPTTFPEAISLDYYKMFLRDTFLVNPIGTGTMQP